jgi:DNA-binding NtrC family response regulator
MSTTLQAKLLRAVEAGEVRRIGENDPRTVDVRFVAATNVDLKAAVDAGEFRSDLYYRLNVHRIHMPPLRDRAGDLRLLVEHFINKYGPASGVERCGDEAWSLLSAYSYPGNVRQLEHIIQRAVAIARGPELAADDLPEEVVAIPQPPPARESTVAAARERADRETIVATLARNAGEIGAAARELQISRTTMWRLMKKYGIPSP